MITTWLKTKWIENILKSTSRGVSELDQNLLHVLRMWIVIFSYIYLYTLLT